MKKFCKYFRDHAMKIVNFKKKKKILTNEQQESNENAKISYICKEKFEDKNAKDKRYRKFRDHCNYADEYTGVAQSICNIKYGIAKEITIVFHNGSEMYNGSTWCSLVSNHCFIVIYYHLSLYAVYS